MKALPTLLLAIVVGLVTVTVAAADDIYDNGAINGSTDAWTINFGYIVSDSFTLSAGTSATGLSFGAWLFPGDTLTSAEVSITSEEFGGTTYFDGIVNFYQNGDCITNGFGYNVCTETGTINGVTLQAGTYWLNLQNASVPNGDPVYWDENSGPSLASENSLGTLPSEAFTLFGSERPRPPVMAAGADPILAALLSRARWSSSARAVCCR